jgi:GNAT superfamily N-acetyltransferase
LKFTEVNGEWHPIGEKGWVFVTADTADGKRAGEMMLSPEKGNRWAVRLVDVYPRYQTQGVASKLYDHAINFAKKKGADTLISDPEGGTKDSVAPIWRKLGAKETGTGTPGSIRFQLKL